MKPRHIALIYAGGTIGMEKTAQGYAPRRDFDALLTRVLEAAGDRLPACTLHQYPTPIDSANAAPDDWQRIARDIAARYADYDGFVVLHGTDTMAYTASALSFMLRGLRKPVIVTGAQVPLGEVRSDALKNLEAALQIAASGRVNEVAICFNRRLLRGNRASKRSSLAFDAFESPNYPSLAEIGIDIRWNPDALMPAANAAAFELPDYRAQVLSLRFVPGMNPQAVPALLALKPHALMLECYGSGNAPDHDPVLRNALERACEQGVVVVAGSQAQHGAVRLGAYAAGAGLHAAGVIGTADMTFEAAYAKLHHLFALGLSPERVRSDFSRELCGELTPA